MKIQAATAEHIPQLIELGPRIFANAIKAIGALDPKAWADEAQRMVVLDDRRAFVAVDGDRIVGIHAVSLSHHLLAAGVDIAATMTNWVAPDARGSGVGTRLQSAAEAWAKEQGAKFMAATVPVDYSAHADLGDSGAAQCAAQAFYEGCGYGRAETMFLKEIR